MDSKIEEKNKEARNEEERDIEMKEMQQSENEESGKLAKMKQETENGTFKPSQQIENIVISWFETRILEHYL